MLPCKEVEAVLMLGETESWCKVSKEISVLVGCGQLGRKMFSVPAREVVGTEILNVITEAIKKLAKSDAAGEKDIIDAKSACKKAVGDLDNIDMLPERRTVTVDYRGWEFPCRVRSWEEEVEIRFHVALRGWWAQLGKIPLLPGEAQLCEQNPSLNIKTFDGCMFLAAQQARKYMETVLKMQECCDGEAAEAGAQTYGKTSIA